MTAPPKNHRWYVLALTVLNLAVVVGIANYCFTLFSVSWLASYGISRSQLMLAIFMMLVMTGLFGPICGKRLDNVSLRMPVIIGLLVYCCGLVILSVASAYWQVIAVYTLLFPFGMILSGNLISQLLINRWFITDKGLALGVSTTGTSIGGVIFPAIVASASASYSMPHIMFVLGIASAIVLIPINFLILRFTPPEPPSANYQDSNNLPLDQFTTRTTVASPMFWIPMVILVPVVTAFAAIQHSLAPYLIDLGFPITFAGQLLALTAFMMIIGKVIYGKLADHVDHRYLLAFASATMIATLVLFIGTPGKIVLIIAATLWGVSGGGLLPLIAVVFATRFPPEVFGHVMGLVMLFMILPSFGTIYMGWMYDLFGSYDLAFALLILFIIPGTLLIKWLPQRLF